MGLISTPWIILPVLYFIENSMVISLQLVCFLANRWVTELAAVLRSHIREDNDYFPVLHANYST
jgi:hypothetical protein